MKWLLVGLCLSGVGCRWFRNADDVAYDEFSPKALLEKYSWYKDASAKLDAKLASIEVAEVRVKGIEEQYKGVPRKEWARVDAEAHSVATQEVAGLKMSYNALSSEYNSRMSKNQYRFTNEGDLPKGATKVLPREYKPYIEK